MATRAKSPATPKKARRTRYCLVGTGGRSSMFSSAIFKDFADRAELVGLCDVNPARMDYYNAQFAERFQATALPTFTPDRFDEMIGSLKADAVIVTSMDRTHHRYICRAMDLGCDAVTEKPMTVDEVKCRQILDTVARTGRRLTVTFNYRYAPRNSKVKELLMSGAIGRVLSVHFEWLLDTRHGADYFRRWHRDKRNSGGLMVHKSTHHFDLVNWWLADSPRTVFGFGQLGFYGRENAEERGVTRFYDFGSTHPNAAGDRFALDLTKSGNLDAMYQKATVHDGYHRDQSVFSDGISIEDDMAVLVRYRGGPAMTYHLTAYSPWEGYRVAFNGTKGRLEYEVHENSYVSGADDDANRPDVRGTVEGDAGWREISGVRHVEVNEPARILVRPLWEKPYEVGVEEAKGGHGGGDVRLLRDVFAPGDADPLGRAANHLDGARSILTGIAANRSFATGLPVEVDTLVHLP